MPAAKSAAKKAPDAKKAAPSHPPYKQMIAAALQGQGKQKKKRNFIKKTLDALSASFKKYKFLTFFFRSKGTFRARHLQNDLR